MRSDMSRIFNSDMYSVLGMGVALRESESMLVRIVLMRSLSFTPKRCSSSTTSNPRFLKCTSWESRRWVPITISTLPVFNPCRILLISYCD